MGADADHEDDSVRTAGAGVKIAVKVIDQTGMEHITVIDDPRGFLPEGNG